MDTEAGARAYGSDGDAAGTGTYRILVAICAVNGACAIALGALVVAWCAVELVFRANVMASGYLVIGLLQTAFAVQMRR